VVLPAMCGVIFLAHGAGPRDFQELWPQWGRAPMALVLLALTAWLYASGLRRLRRAAPRAVKTHTVGCFALGWSVLFFALATPLHPWGEVLFCVHMVQHELLMLIAAPLLVLSRAGRIFLWALPKNWAFKWSRFTRGPAVVFGLASLTNPLFAWLFHAAVLWGWHAPQLFQAATDNEWIHALQHASFFGSALVFWTALFQGPRRALGYGAAVLYLFTTAIHTTLLGAMLTFSREIWYPIYAATTIPWGLTPLQDQQLGGLIMWVPGALVYIAASLALFTAWLRESEHRARMTSPIICLEPPQESRRDADWNQRHPPDSSETIFR
jgi:putative membrane protein